MNAVLSSKARTRSPRTLIGVWAMIVASCLGCGEPTGPAERAAEATPSTTAGERGPIQAAEKAETGAVTAAAFPSGRVVDLTHAFGIDTIFWPTDTAGFQFEKGPYGVTDRGYFYSANRFAMAEHGGTHLDAPIHFSQQGVTSDEIPLSKLLGDAALIDVSEACRNNPDYQVSIADLRAWEEQHERQLVDVIVLLRTGYFAHWTDRQKYLGTAATGEEALRAMHFPGLDPEAARWLVEHRAPKAVGIDTASIDFGQSYQFESHVQLCGHNVPIFENVANLGGLPTADFRVIALPMKIAAGSGGPLRIVAILRE